MGFESWERSNIWHRFKTIAHLICKIFGFHLWETVTFVKNTSKARLLWKLKTSMFSSLLDGVDIGRCWWVCSGQCLPISSCLIRGGYRMLTLIWPLITQLTPSQNQWYTDKIIQYRIGLLEHKMFKRLHKHSFAAITSVKASIYASLCTFLTSVNLKKTVCVGLY